MHIIGLILSVLGAAAFWYYRYQHSRQLIGDAADAVGRARGAYRRSKFRKKVHSSVLAGIDDPVLGTTVLLVSLAEAAAPMTHAQEARIKTILQQTTGMQCTDEHITFARWACRETPDANQVVRGLIPLWQNNLSQDEKRDVLDMARQIINQTESPQMAQEDALRRLKNGLLPT
ncbi:MAG: hypothetical protein ABJN26_10965 [Stappiaceae bacterium]